MSQNDAHVDDRPLDEFFGPQSNNSSRELELQGQAMMNHFSNRVLPSLQGYDDNALRIPKTIHFIWLGSSEIPNQDTCLSSWRQFHPEWDIRLWTETSLLEAPEWFNRDALDYALRHRNYGMASDILRLELLWQYGGLYVDTDYMCCNTLDDLHHCLEFYCGASCTQRVEVNNGLLASRPQHPLIHHMMSEIHSWWKNRQMTFAQVSAFLDDTSSLALAKDVSHNETIANTGPGLLTRMVGTCLQTVEGEECGKVAVFPFTYFHPFPNTERRSRDCWRQFVRDDTRAVHLWQCSWQDSSS